MGTFSNCFCRIMSLSDENLISSLAPLMSQEEMIIIFNLYNRVGENLLISKSSSLINNYYNINAMSYLNN